jgi:biopolymer transport protein ExbB
MSTEKTLMELMLAGGWVMWALFVLSLASLAVGVERSWVLRRARSPVAALASALRRTLGSGLRPGPALEAVQRVGGSAGRVLAAGLRRFPRSPVQIEAAMERQALAELRRLRRGLGVLASTSVTAPLLGFLGTVTGMISSFGAMADYGTSNPALVAHGIEEALITTAAGLAVAVPVHLILGLLSSRVSRIASDIEELAHLLLELREREDAEADAPLLTASAH